MHYPRGSICTTIMELGPQNHNGDGLLELNSIIVVYMDPLGILNIGALRVRIGAPLKGSLKGSNL